MTNINSIKDRIKDVLTEDVGFIEEDYLFDLLEEALKRIEHIESVNKSMHSQVSGYLSGESWSHWQELNEERFKV